MRSIKHTLNIRQALIQVILFSIFSFAIYQFVENRLLHEFDKSLETLANAGTGTVEVEYERGKLEVEIEDDHSPAYDHTSTLFFLRDPKGKVRFNPSKIDFKSWPPPPIPNSGFTQGEILMPDGRPARFRSQRFKPVEEHGAKYEGGEWCITVATEISSIQESLTKILLGCISIGGLATALTLLANFYSIRSGLKPLDNISSEVTKLEATSLDHHFDTNSLPSELQPIGSKLNELFQRLNEAFKREQRFTSNAAHELRTPLAELQAILQVGKNWQPENLAQDNPINYFSDGSDVTKRMSRLLDSLLTLSRQTPESLSAQQDELTFPLLAEKVVNQIDTENRVTVIDVGPIDIVANEDLLIAVLTNLLNNAIDHSSGEITLSFAENEKTVSFSVTNKAPNLSEEDIAFLREPFWRKEKARSDHNHLGLGLNLIESFCRSQKWDLDLHLDKDKTLSVTVSNIEKAPAATTIKANKGTDLSHGNYDHLEEQATT